MLTKPAKETWAEFLDFIQERCSAIEINNWFAPIKVIETDTDTLCLEVPNVFVKEYILANYKKELSAFVPLNAAGDLAITFVIQTQKIEKPVAKQLSQPDPQIVHEQSFQFNAAYTFDNFIEGPSNQFVKSAALGVAKKPCKSYNPLFIYGGVGLGKTHLLHAVGHTIQKEHRRLKIHCITTEGFINDLVSHLKSKSTDKMKRFYRSLDVLMVDDIQFLQNRLNFEDEFCNTFESLINQNKQIIITSDKPPSELKLSQRLIARMEWGLVAHIGAPELETRVAILQHKAESRGFVLPQKVAFFIAERIFNNVRQLEGAINKLSAYCHLMGLELTEDTVEKILGELFQYSSASKRLSVENILTSVSSIFDVKVNDLKGATRTKDITLPRQVAMYLAKELLSESLSRISSAFGGKTRSTLLHAWKKISGQVQKDEDLRRQVDLAKKKLEE